MPSVRHEITALPVVIPLASVVFAFLLWRLHRRHAMTWPRVVLSATLCVYGAGVIGNTLLPIFIGGASHDDLQWWEHGNFVPLVGTELDDMLQNVLVFIPLGVLLPLIVRIRSARHVLLLGFLTSLTMELLQYVNTLVADGGHIADINDLLANTLGTPIGYALHRLAIRLPVLERLASAFSWPHLQAEKKR
jgi:hypothetical protein